jgi:hypothetical protein
MELVKTGNNHFPIGLQKHPVLGCSAKHAQEKSAVI